MGDKIRKWIAVLLAGSILAMIQLVPAGGAVFVRENIENKEILGEKETSLQQTLHARAWVLMWAYSGGERCGYRLSDGKHDEDSDLHSRTGTGKSR